MKLILSFLFLIGIAHFACGGEISISGRYQGKNVYVQNPFTVNKNEYCTDRIYVNDQLVLNNPGVSAFEIDLSYLPLNAPVVIKITYKADCSPQVVNPNVIEVDDAFKFLTLLAEVKSVRWITENEPAGSHYFLERLTEDSWVEIADIPAKGGEINNFYKLPVSPKEGINIYRVKLVQPEGSDLYSEEMKLLNE